MCYGNGGHKEQSCRLVSLFDSSYDNVIFLSLTDNGTKPNWSKAHLEVGEMRDKYTGSFPSPFKVIKNFFEIRRFLKKNNVINIVSFGPGVSVLTYLSSFGIAENFYHFETWSKFSSLSITSKILAKLGCHIFYQNKELSSLINNGTYVGRL